MRYGNTDKDIFEDSKEEREQEEYKRETINNIYLNSETVKNKVFKDSTPQTRYIILMNDTLQAENRNLNNRITELEIKQSEMEEEADKADTSKRYIKGLLKNLVELEKMRDEISKISKNITYNIKNNYNKLLNTVTIIIMILIFTPIIYFNYYQLFSIIILIFYLVKNKLKLTICPEFYDENKKINEIEFEIKKIKDTQDFLSEYIDNL